jgi:hypothetical protein
MEIQIKDTQQKCGEIIYFCPNCNHELQLSVVAREASIDRVSETENKKHKRKIVNKKRQLAKQQTLSSEITNAIFPFEKLLNRIPNLVQSSNFPICLEITHKGFWITNSEGYHESTMDQQCDRNSVMLTNECLLYVYKLALRHLLLSSQVINPSEIDAANLVPHIVVRKNKSDPFSKYNQIQCEKLIITEKMLTAKCDFLLVELDIKRDLHTTLIYSKKINKKINLIEAMKIVLSILNQYPYLIQEYSQLPYFGLNAIDYWLEIVDSYPFHPTPPHDYQPKPKKTIDMSSYQLSPAGSLLGNI